MKQFPNKLKYKKYHKKNNFFLYHINKKNYFLSFGQFAIQSLETGLINFKEIESCRRTLKRGIKKLGLIWIKVFTNIPSYKKSFGSRMGKGKGNFLQWICAIKKGEILFEISGINILKSFNILNKSKTKISLKTQIIKIIY